MATLKIIATFIMVQQLLNIVHANFTISPQIPSGSYLQVTIPYNTSARYVVAQVTKNPTQWKYEGHTGNSTMIVTIDGGETLFADDSKEANMRPVFTWTNQTQHWNPQDQSGLWELEYDYALYYIRNVKYNEYLCVNRNVNKQKVKNAQLVFTMPPQFKEYCGKWNLVGIFGGELASPDKA